VRLKSYTEIILLFVDTAQGVKLLRDTAGSVYLSRQSECDVTVRGVREQCNTECLTDDVIRSNGTVGRDKTKVETVTDGVSVAQWLGSRTSDLAVMGSILVQALSGTLVNSAFHPSGVGKSSTNLHWLGLRRGAFACVGWQVTLCDPMWQATPCSSEMGFH